MANLRYLRIVDGSVTKQIDDLGKEYPHTCFPRGGIILLGYQNKI